MNNYSIYIKETTETPSNNISVPNKSHVIVVLNAGLAQGCVLSPLLFFVYTGMNELQCNKGNLTSIK